MSRPIAFELHRDGAKTAKGNFYGTDTTLLSENLKPATYYRFHALRLDNDKITDSSGTIEVRTMDTSVHAYTWEVQYFGDGQSSFYDITVINDTCAYAVGEIYVKDSTGKYEDTYNAAKWDGKKWQLIRIMINSCGTQVYKPFAIRCAYGLNPSLVYFGAGVLGYYDGKQFFKDCSQVGKWTGSLFKIWSQNTSTQWLVGSNGWTCRKDQAVYTNIPSGTTRDLNDINGNDNEIWAVGGYPNKNEGVVVFNDRGTWKLKDSLSNNGTFPVRSVWVDELGYYNNGFLGLAGRGIRYFDVHWQEPPIQLVGGNMGLGRLFFNSIRGTSRNNIFAVGHFGIVLHYNGHTWQFYPELFRYPESRYLTSCSVTENSVFIVGIEDDRGIIIHGKKN